MSATMNSFSAKDAKRFEALKSQPGLSGNTRVALEMMAANGLINSGHSYIGIGAGDGELEHHLAANHSANVGYIDPSANLADIFKKRMQSSSLESKILDFSVRDAATALIEHPYHCALAIHSWYYIGYSEETLHRMVQSLHPDGSLCILLHADHSIVDRISGFKESAGRPVRAEPLLTWIKEQGYRGSLEYCSDSSPAERYLNADGSFTASGRSWIAYMLRLDESSVAENVWTRCRSILTSEGSRITFKYGWIRIEK